MANDTDTTQISLGAIKPPSVLIYEYGIRVDREHRAAVAEEISRARKAYNEIIAVMRDVHAQARHVTLQHASTECRKLHDRMEAIQDEFRLARGADDRDLMRDLARERKLVWCQLKPLLAEARKAAAVDLRPVYGRIGNKASCETYQVRSAAVKAGLGFANATEVLGRALKAWDSSKNKGRPPKFSVGALRTQDTITLQFTEAGGVPSSRLLEGGHRELNLSCANGCGRRKYNEFGFRIGSKAVATVVTGTWQYHRPLPENSSVMGARLVRRVIGKDQRYALQFVVRLPEPLQLQVPAGRKPLACVHFGWSMDMDGRRVAGIADAADPGLARIVRMDPTVEVDLKAAAEIEATRDEDRNAMMLVLRDIDLDSLQIPEALLEELKSMRRLPAEHLAKKRLHRFVHDLKRHGVELGGLEAWAKRDRLRWQDASHRARRARNRRRNDYQHLGLELASRYEAVVIEPLELAEAAAKVDEHTGEHTEMTRKARAGRMVAAPYELESAIRWACDKHATPLIELAAAKTAASCAYCGEATCADEADSQTLHCTGCGAEIDRKHNGAARAWQATIESVPTLIEEFKMLRTQTIEDARAAAAERKRTMAEGRAAIRRKRAEDDKAVEEAKGDQHDD